MTEPPRDLSDMLTRNDTLTDLAAGFRRDRRAVGAEWTRRITAAGNLNVLSAEEISIESIALCDHFVDALESGMPDSIRSYARTLSRRIVPRRVEMSELLGAVLTLRDVLARALVARHADDPDRLSAALLVFEPVANRIATTVAEGILHEHERVIQLQQAAINELSTPVLLLRERLLIHPIIGVVDAARARQMTEQLLEAIRRHRASVVVMDLTGVATVDAAVATHLVEAVEASRLLGASMIVTGLSPEVSQTLVSIDIDLSSLHAVGDLQGGIVEAEALLGYRVVRTPDAPRAALAGIHT